MHVMFARIVVALSFLLAAVTPVWAINSEGHDDFFHEDVPLPRLTNGIETPRRVLPPCSERATAAKDNPYEQQPLPRINCIEDRATDPD